jgi:hypothetical protein
MKCLRKGSGPRPSRPFGDPLAGDGDGAAPRPPKGRGRSAAEDPSTAFLFCEEWRRLSRRQGKKVARRVALCLRLWPDRRMTKAAVAAAPSGQEHGRVTAAGGVALGGSHLSTGGKHASDQAVASLTEVLTHYNSPGAIAKTLRRLRHSRIIKRIDAVWLIDPDFIQTESVP